MCLLFFTRVSPQAMKSVNVFILFIILPACRHSFTQLTTAANMRDHVNNPAIEQTQPARRKAWGDRDSVRTVCVKQQRSCAVKLDPFAINHRHRNPCAIRRSSKQSAQILVCSIKTAGHFRLFHQRPCLYSCRNRKQSLASRGIVVVTHHCGIELPVRAQPAE